jgi:hypothetical protein
MRNQTPLAPGEPAFDVTVHIVLNDFEPVQLLSGPAPPFSPLHPQWRHASEAAVIALCLSED